MSEWSLLRKVLVNIVAWVVSLIMIIPFIVMLLITFATKGTSAFKPKERTAPKIIRDPKWGTHRFVQLPLQRVKLHYVEKGDRNKPLLLCLHGFPDCWFSYRDTLVEFSKDFWVVAVDMRGYGESDKPTGLESYKTDNLVEDIREFIEVLGKESCYLLAHDWGGVLAWILIHKYPNLFKKHVSLNGPHASAIEDELMTSFSQIRKSFYVHFFQFWYIPELLLSSRDCFIFDEMFQKEIRKGRKMTDEEVEVYKYYFGTKDAFTGPLNYYRRMITTNVNLSNMRCDKVESLIIWGLDDTALNQQIATKTFRYCDNLEAKFIADSGHFVLQEQPEKVHAYIRKFLNS